MTKAQRDDRSTTRDALSVPPDFSKDGSWLHKGKQAAFLDKALISGASIQEMAQALIDNGLSKRDLDTTIKRVRRHLDHLGMEAHKLPLKVTEGKWSFDRNAL